MEVITDITDDITQITTQVLSENGRLSTAIPGFVSRSQQIQLAKAIADSIKNHTSLIAEAGTGTGKTFAYLTPCLLSDKKIILSTATKTLQDQLFNKDLPTLIRALGLSKKIQNLKGRANYICHYRTELNAEEGHFKSKQSASEILLIRKRISRMVDGVKSELPEIKEDSPVWPFVTSTTENCLGGECPAYKKCFLVKARKKALEADVVVINHHLFFADSKLKEGGFGELLPGSQVIVFDEAHQLADTAVNFYGERISTRQIQDLLKDAIREWPILDLANQPLNQLLLNLEKVIDALLLSLGGMGDKVEWSQCIYKEAFSSALDQLKQLMQDFKDCFQALLEGSDETDVLSPGLKRCYERLDLVITAFKNLVQPSDDMIRWIERYKQSLVFNATPNDVSKTFSSILSKQKAAWIFTSATLTAQSSFNSFTRPLGLESSETLKLPSPFDFKQQAMLYLPRGMPDPKHQRYYECLIEKARQIIDACQGRCFFLFTSHKALNYAAQVLEKNISYPLLVQGQESKSILLSRFRELGHAVLLGTATFWEGVDVKGEALSCVIIDKLPFSSPSDPLIRGKMNFLKSRGLSPFDELSLPGAILSLKQGVGRLIRDHADKGLLVIADPRITGRPYGGKILSSLPDMVMTRDHELAMNFIKTHIST